MVHCACHGAEAGWQLRGLGAVSGYLGRRKCRPSMGQPRVGRTHRSNTRMLQSSDEIAKHEPSGDLHRHTSIHTNLMGNRA